MNITELSPQQMTEAFHVTNFFSLLSLYLSFLIIFPIITAMLKTKKTNWGRFFWVWFLTALTTGAILLFLIYSPEIIYSIVDKSGMIG